jgi:hypothetical protein
MDFKHLVKNALRTIMELGSQRCAAEAALWKAA